VGLGISGLWTARYLAYHGADATVSDINPESSIDSDMCREIRALGVKLESGGHDRKTFLNTDLIIISPGVPHDMALLQDAKKNGVHVMGELELASRLIDTPMIAITGTNGKSTVTAALGRVLENAGFEVFMGGNIGTPLMAYAAGERKADYAVVEVSSFQLDTIETFSPQVSVVLNISPDHLDRYPSYENYVQSKMKIFSNQKPGQYAVLNGGDERLASVSPVSGVSVMRYGFGKSEDRHAYIENKEILVCLDGKSVNRFSFESYKLPGKHNLENLMAIVLVSQLLGVDPIVIQENIDGFRGLPNRLELVSEIGGVAFYNDSKATNVDAAARAISSFDRPVILIAGGRHKGADYEPLVRISEKKVKKAVFLGEAKELLSAAFEGAVPFSMAQDMEEAVSMAFACAKDGDAVLLAPACSSFDMFTDYGHRGSVFRSTVERLGDG
jgi:UDP-N-acetylmuramoylalanine--D-glutamate ligase